MSNFESTCANARPADRLWILGWSLFVLPCSATSLLPVRYLMHVGPAVRQVLSNLNAHPWLDIHVAGSAVALLGVPYRFRGRFRQKLPQGHQWLGYLYASGAMIGGVAGIPDQAPNRE